VATPLAFVLALAVFEPPVNVPLAPLAGAVKVTDTLGTALPAASFTVACRAVANAALIVALCGVPAVAVIVAAGPGLLVSEKLTVVSPVAAAVTV